MNDLKCNRRTALLTILSGLCAPHVSQAMTRSPDVVVIGAGSSGIAAARRLIASGKSVVILEAANRIGGRAYTESDTFGIPYDQGCAWLQGPEDLPHVGLAKELGFDLHDHSNARDALYVNGKRAAYAESGQYDRSYAAIQQAVENTLDDRAVATVIPENLPFSSIVQSWMAMAHGVDMVDLSTSDYNAYIENEVDYLVREGLGTLVAHLGRELPVTLNAAVSAIDWSGKGVLEPYMSWVKSVTTKPVVTVGRFTSPDTMVSQVKRGITDFIGAARPSIADPYIPRKIEEGRAGDIRECIGCNVCYSGDSLGVPIRCTQNPTMGEEWRKGWHPEKVLDKGSDARVLFVGAGTTGLEAARVAGERGYQVMLAEASREIGGRITREARLPGMSEHASVRDYREGQLLKLANVEVFPDSRLCAADVIEVEAQHVAIATGAIWRRERFDGKSYVTVATDGAPVFTPDDIMDGNLPETGPCFVFDGDNYYMGSLMAEVLADDGLDVTYITEEDSVSSWAGNTSERWRIRTQMMQKGIHILQRQSMPVINLPWSSIPVSIMTIL